MLGKQWEMWFFGKTKSSPAAVMISFVFDVAFMPSDPSYGPNVLFIPHVFSDFSFSAEFASNIVCCTLSLSEENVILCVWEIARLLENCRDHNRSVWSFRLPAFPPQSWSGGELCASSRATPSTGEGEEWPKGPNNVHVMFIKCEVKLHSGFLFFLFSEKKVKWVRNRGEIKRGN